MATGKDAQRWASFHFRGKLQGINKTNLFCFVLYEGNPCIRGSKAPSISGDGRYVAFDSDAANAAYGDSNNAPDIFVKDTLTGLTIRISMDVGGALPNGSSLDASISADGRYAAFESWASNLIPGDTNGFHITGRRPG